MKMIFRTRPALAVAAAFSLLVAPPAFAHADHGKPMHGGLVAEAAQFQGELVVTPKTLTVYVYDHGTPVPTAGASARLVVLAGTQKQEIALAPAGENRFASSTALDFRPGTKAVATVKLSDGRSGALRFEAK